MLCKYYISYPVIDKGFIVSKLDGSDKVISRCRVTITHDDYTKFFLKTTPILQFVYICNRVLIPNFLLKKLNKIAEKCLFSNLIFKFNTTYLETGLVTL